MPRPRIRRRIRFCPRVRFFKPAGVPLRALEVVALDRDETEALRLKHMEGLSQNAASKKMGVSQSTFQRILSKAQAKLAEAMVKGKGIRIQDENAAE